MTNPQNGSEKGFSDLKFPDDLHFSDCGISSNDKEKISVRWQSLIDGLKFVLSTQENQKELNIDSLKGELKLFLESIKETMIDLKKSNKASKEVEITALKDKTSSAINMLKEIFTELEKLSPGIEKHLKKSINRELNFEIRTTSIIEDLSKTIRDRVKRSNTLPFGIKLRKFQPGAGKTHDTTLVTEIPQRASLPSVIPPSKKTQMPALKWETKLRPHLSEKLEEFGKKIRHSKITKWVGIAAITILGGLFTKKVATSHSTHQSKPVAAVAVQTPMPEIKKVLEDESKVETTEANQTTVVEQKQEPVANSTVTAQSTNPKFKIDAKSAAFTKYLDIFNQHEMFHFTKALEDIAEKTEVELNGETGTSANLKLYHAFLDKGVEAYKDHPGSSLYQFFNLRLEKLKKVEQKLKDGKLNETNLFNSERLQEDKLMFSAIKGVAMEVDNKTYGIETNAKVNPAAAEIKARGQKAGANSIDKVLSEALIETEQHPSARKELVKGDFFKIALRIAEERRSKDKTKTDASPNVVRQLEEATKKGIKTPIGTALDKIVPIQKTENAQESATPKQEKHGSLQKQKGHKAFRTYENNWFATGNELSAQHEEQQAKNDAAVRENPNLFTYEEKPKKESIFSKATAFLKKQFEPKPQTETQKEQSELAKSIPKESILKSFRNYLG